MTAVSTARNAAPTDSSISMAAWDSVNSYYKLLFVISLLAKRSDELGLNKLAANSVKI